MARRIRSPRATCALILGLERKIIGGLSHRVEVGYVFNREIKLASDGKRDRPRRLGVASRRHRLLNRS